MGTDSTRITLLVTTRQLLGSTKELSGCCSPVTLETDDFNFVDHRPAREIQCIWTAEIVEDESLRNKTAISRNLNVEDLGLVHGRFVTHKLLHEWEYKFIYCNFDA